MGQGFCSSTMAGWAKLPQEAKRRLLLDEFVVFGQFCFPAKMDVNGKSPILKNMIYTSMHGDK